RLAKAGEDTGAGVRAANPGGGQEVQSPAFRAFDPRWIAADNSSVANLGANLWGRSEDGKTASIRVCRIPRIICFGLVMYAGFLMRDPPLSPLQSNRDDSGYLRSGLLGPQHQVLPGLL